MHALDPRLVNLWRLQGLARIGGQLPLWLGVLVLGVRQVGLVPGLAAVGTIVLVQGVVALVWPGLAWARFRYAVRAHDLLLVRGVLFRRVTSIPLDRIQHVDLRQGPLARMMGLQEVVVTTAAALGADGTIPGLDTAVAEALRDELIARSRGARADDGV